ncbi:MAG: hypothetical protein RBS37_08485 [Bacteroidales bacterium]|jgi:hypothetical protein|nr:hypothetical protein [Bacteroidales bacterium]
MDLILLYSAGFGKSLRTVRVIILMWTVSLAGHILVFIPLMRNLEMILDGSIIPELFYDGFYLEIFNDVMRAVMPAFTTFSIAFFLITIIIFLLNTFLTAGLFRLLAGDWRKPYGRRAFLLGADRGFGGFLFIAIVAGSILFLLFAILVPVPMAFTLFSMAGNREIMIVGMAGGTLFLIISPFVLLVADYARVLLTADKWLTPFRAMVEGFQCLRGRMLKGWLVMAVLLALSMAMGWSAFRLAASGRSQTGFLWFLLPVLSQALFFIGIWVKVIRYGTVTAFHEGH